MSARYRIVAASRVDEMVLRHAAFLANVSLSAVNRFRAELAQVTEQLRENPYLFPLEQDPALPEGKYRKALFAKRYKVLFWVADNIVYVDAVCDCREELTDLF